MYDFTEVSENASIEEQFELVRKVMTHVTMLAWIISQSDRLFQIGRNTYEFVIALSENGLEVDGFDFFKTAIMESFEEMSEMSGLEFPSDLNKEDMFKAAIGMLWIQRMSDYLEIRSRSMYKDLKADLSAMRSSAAEQQEEE